MKNDHLTESESWLKERVKERPEVGMVLGSGLSDSLDSLDNSLEMSWGDIPGFPTPTVKGHKGKLLFSEIAGKNVMVQQGRLHWYEGKGWREVIFPIRLQKLMGVKQLIITNAAGSIDKDLEPGDLVTVTDHINFSGDNPLRGSNDERFGVRFPDLTDAYTEDLRETARKAGDNLGVDLGEGVYVMTTGPSYETPAEIRALRTLGADLVGMSTVPEVITARHAEMEVLAISCVTNKAAGMQDQLTHEEVMEVTASTNETLGNLIEEIVSLL
ncbi:MAG: purine-nucleoside phosphorylase [Candidatus Bipolaricaulota bacterium]